MVRCSDDVRAILWSKSEAVWDRTWRIVTYKIAMLSERSIYLFVLRQIILRLILNAAFFKMVEEAMRQLNIRVLNLEVLRI